MQSTVPRFALLGLLLAPGIVVAQHKIAYVDSDFITEHVPAFATAQQTLDRMAQEWEAEVQGMQKEVDDKYREYQARELLYTQDERQRRQQEIVGDEEEVERLRFLYFGPNGELFKQQEQLLRPIQEKVLIAVEAVAESEDFDYVFDRSGDFLFLYATERHNISLLVLEELGISTTEPATRTGTGQ